MREIWKEIPDYDGRYFVSNLGNVKSIYFKKRYKEILLQQYSLDKKYMCVSLTKNWKSKHKKVHRLVAEAFIPNIENKSQVNHKDGNKTNNNVDNLEWCSCSDNLKHAYKTGLRPSHRKIVMLNKNNGSKIMTFNNSNEACQYIGVNNGNGSICNVCNGKLKTAYGYKWSYENMQIIGGE